MDIFNLQKNQAKDTFSVGADKGIRKGFNEFIDRHSSWFVYIRRDRRYPGVSYEASAHSGDINDQDTFGLGYQVSYEKHKARKVQTAGSAQSPLEPFGYLAKFRTVIYTPRYYYPKSKDLYLEVEWDTDLANIQRLGKPINIINAYQVDESLSFNEDEVSFMASGCDTYNFDVEVLNNWLKALGEVWVTDTSEAISKLVTNTAEGSAMVSSFASIILQGYSLRGTL